MIGKKTKLRLINWWPLMWGAGIRVKSISQDYKRIEVELIQRWFNLNIVGVHYGGSLYSMCDPWYMLQLMEWLRSVYIVWDKSAQIRFRKPGKGKLTARFEVTEMQLVSIKKSVEEHGKYDCKFSSAVLNEEGEVVAEVEKVVYVRKQSNETSN
jgi:hypothetical protein